MLASGNSEEWQQSFRPLYCLHILFRYMTASERSWHFRFKQRNYGGFFGGFLIFYWGQKRQNPLHERVSAILTGGERGIRTLDRLLTYTRFPGVLLKPLGHLTGVQ